MPPPKHPKKPQTLRKSSEDVSEDEQHEEGRLTLAEPHASQAMDTTTVLTAIQDMSNKMDNRFNSLETSLKASQATLLEHANRIAAMENMSSDIDDRLLKLEQRTGALEAANKALQEKVIDLESRSRRQNIKIIGLPENMENGRPADFVSQLFPTLFGRQHFSKPVKVDRAHRLGSQSANNANRPRVLIARIHNDRSKELILQLAKQQVPLMYQGKRIHIYPDFPAEVMRRRQLFEDVRKKLKAAGIRTGFIYPARLIVTHGNVTSRFDTPEEAKRYAETAALGTEGPEEQS